MIWIPEYLSKTKTEASSDQTLYIDLPEKEQISFLQCDISIKNGDVMQSVRSMMDAIDKIEVIADGVKTIYNCEPEIASYIQFVTQDGIYPKHSFNYVANQRQTLRLIIPFGRHLFDEEYMLDTGLYDSVQLRIPYTLDANYDALASFRHTIVMWRPLEKLAPVGFIRSRAVQKETSNTAIETINHKLPMTYPWRYLGVRLEDDDENIISGTTNIKLNVDEGRVVLYDLLINELMNFDKRRYPKTTYYAPVAGLVSQDEVKIHVDYPAPLSIVHTGITANMYRVYSFAGEIIALAIYDSNGTEISSGNQAMVIKAGGPNLHKCLTLYDGRKEPFPAAGFTQAKVEYTLAAKETIIQTFIQEVVLGTLS